MSTIRSYINALMFSSVLVANAQVFAELKLDQEQFEFAEAIKIQLSNDLELEISYVLPCGASQVGLYVEQRGEFEIAVGIINERNRSSCAGLPKIQRFSLGSVLDIKKIKKIVKLSASRFSNLDIKLESPELVQKSSHDGSYFLSMATGSKCGKIPDAYLLRSSGQSKSLEVALVHLSKRGHRSITSLEASACQFSQLRKDLSFVRLRRFTRVRAYKVRREAKDIYDLQIRPFEILSQNHAYSYRRFCHEAPVGLVVQQGPAKAYLGVLVARFINHPCRNDAQLKKRSIKESVRMEYFSLAKVENFPASILDRHGFSKFRMRSPMNVSIGTDQSMGVKYLSNQEESEAMLVFSLLENKNMIGVLEKNSTLCQRVSCNLKTNRVSLEQGSIKHSYIGKSMFPLRMGRARYL